MQSTDKNKENPLPFDLVATEATIYDLPNELASNIVGLVITDQHFGKWNVSFTKSFSTFKDKLNDLLNQTNPTCLFMLGDTIDYSNRDWEQSFYTVFDYLESLEIPVFLLGGNHDKERIINLNYEFDQNLIFVKETFIRIKHPNPNNENYSGILLGHDLGNNFLVDPPDAPIYVKWMKDVFKKYFSQGEMMLLGHTHQNISIEEDEAYSIKQFSPVFRSYQYALIKDDGQKYTVTFSEMKEK